MVQPAHPKLIGLLGGAFNPAHDGHIHISKCAKDMLKLDEVWWLVAHQHPTKTTPALQNFDQRLRNARQCTHPYPFIKISDIEKNVGTRYSIDTLHALRTIYPDHHFIWLIGADNLITLHHWHRWQEILDCLPIAIFDRDRLKAKALTSPFATHFFSRMIQNPQDLTSSPPYHWCFLNIKKHPAASSDLRKKM
jgi:nicotinate-nucleotide adenylyltransferase